MYNVLQWKFFLYQRRFSSRYEEITNGIDCNVDPHTREIRQIFMLVFTLSNNCSCITVLLEDIFNGCIHDILF